MSDRPLFIPLAAVHYDRFDRGEKDTEWRAYGPRWNERTCTVGRPVILSRGYGKKNRRTGRIVQFRKLPRSNGTEDAQRIYPRAQWFSAIRIELDTVDE